MTGGWNSQGGRDSYHLGTQTLVRVGVFASEVSPGDGKRFQLIMPLMVSYRRKRVQVSHTLQCTIEQLHVVTHRNSISVECCSYLAQMKRGHKTHFSVQIFLLGDHVRIWSVVADVSGQGAQVKIRVCLSIGQRLLENLKTRSWVLRCKDIYQGILHLTCTVNDCWVRRNNAYKNMQGVVLNGLEEGSWCHKRNILIRGRWYESHRCWHLLDLQVTLVHRWDFRGQNWRR